MPFSLAQDHEFKRAIEAIKLRAPVEDVVRERVPDLKLKGGRWWACCPFHDEDTPSFSVTPSLGIWYCFGACSTGGDQIKFLQRLDGLSFMEALELLAARTGVELPRNRARKPEGDDAGLAALQRADEFYQAQLATPDGRRVLAYMHERGLTDNTIAAFGVGYAPASGHALVDRARRDGIALKDLQATGLARTTDAGRAYDFFRGRLTIPIRDIKGRTVGFGARRLADDEASGPKYINTPETPWFHKGRIVYALDRALDVVRRGGHLVLVEGYTDVMAAHQAGLGQVAAVLGTSTTADHAGLVRRCGARRVSLVFDGDAAGRNAAYKALHGLLPLGIEIDVVSLPAGSDPCDLLMSEGAEPFLAALELGAEWFDFLVSGLTGLKAATLAREVDRALELLGRLQKPVHRDALIGELAERLSLPVASLREQWDALPRGRRELAGGRPTTEQEAPASGADRPKPVDPRLRRAYGGIVGALLLDDSLVPLARSVAAGCPDQELAAIFAAIFALYEDEDAVIDVNGVMNALADHPARDRVASIAEYARTAENPKSLLDGELGYLRERALEQEKAQLLEQIPELERAVDEGRDDAAKPLSELLSRLVELHQRGRTPLPL
ncbi:MAG: DNA primase [Planctomycetota bacterium]|nr:MAG: DNA primase [Planctomycetota bacterium]